MLRCSAIVAISTGDCGESYLIKLKCLFAYCCCSGNCLLVFIITIDYHMTIVESIRNVKNFFYSTKKKDGFHSATLLSNN